MKSIRKHLEFLKILKETIPVVWNMIESGNDFDTAMKLMDNAFTLINQKLSSLTVTHQLRKRITDAEFKSKRKIEEEFQQLIDYTITTMIQFSPSSNNEEYKVEFYKFLSNYFKEDQVLWKIKLDYLHQGWTFNYISSKQEIFLKFRFLMANMIKMNWSEDLIWMVTDTLWNQSKRYYNLI